MKAPTDGATDKELNMMNRRRFARRPARKIDLRDIPDRATACPVCASYRCTDPGEATCDGLAYPSHDPAPVRRTFIERD